jgi:hypothetical protein
MKNKEFRQKLMKGAKVEDLYLQIEDLKDIKMSSADALAYVQKWIEKNFDYKPVNK